MKHSLLLVGVVAALAIGTPAYSQYIFMDVDGDSVCTSADILTESTTAVDVWLDTNHNAAGTEVSCVNASQPLDIFAYDILIGSSGGVSFLGWTNYLANFSGAYGSSTFLAAGDNMGVGYLYTQSGALPAGRYKVGTVAVTVTGSPTLSFLTSRPAAFFPEPGTFFGSDCDGTTKPNSITLGIDFFDECHTTGGTPTKSTTWGAIKNLYR